MGRDVPAITVSQQDRRQLPRKGAPVPGRARPDAARFLVRDHHPAGGSRGRGEPGGRFGHGVDAQPGRAGRDRGPVLGSGARPVQSRGQHAAAAVVRRRPGPAGGATAGQPEARRPAGQGRGQPPRHGRHPAQPPAGRRERGRHVGEPAVLAAERADLRGARGRRADRDRGPGTAADPRGQHHGRGGLHQRAVSPPGQPGVVRQLLERGPGHRGRAGRAGRQLAVPVRPGAVAGNQDHAVPAGHRHQAGGAPGAGGAAPGLVR